MMPDPLRYALHGRAARTANQDGQLIIEEAEVTGVVLIAPIFIVNDHLFDRMVRKLMERFPNDQLEVRCQPLAAYPDVQELKIRAKGELLTIREVTRYELFRAKSAHYVETQIIGEWWHILEDRRTLTPLGVAEVFHKIEMEAANALC